MPRSRRPAAGLNKLTQVAHAANGGRAHERLPCCAHAQEQGEHGGERDSLAQQSSCGHAQVLPRRGEPRRDPEYDYGERQQPHGAQDSKSRQKRRRASARFGAS